MWQQRRRRRVGRPVTSDSKRKKESRGSGMRRNLRLVVWQFVSFSVLWAIQACALPVLPPTASANFSPSTVVAGGSKTTTYTLTISNPNGSDLTNVQFTNTYPAGLVRDLIGNYTCGTTYALHPAGNPGGTNGGSGSFTATGFSFTLNTLPAGDSCTV